ncbi:MAG TPA: O-antigen ligase family protein [Bryobacteraceae bacterium]|nr:O-antigen ligase family protein [Bryobacteraceae bacterium]
MKLPLGIFFALTVLAVAFSGHAREGWPGIRKFYLCLVLLLVASTFRTVRDVWSLVAALAAGMAVSAALSLWQFRRKYEMAAALHESFREYYTPQRITGFTSHWMTLSGEEMIVLLLITALLYFAARRRGTGWIGAAAGVIALSLVLGWTRSMWMGAALGLVYLTWLWRPRYLLLLPVAAAALLWANPAGVGDRIRSIERPAGDLDSNRFRVVARRAGWEMIQAHPWLGLGPEQVREQFKAYIPADEPRPLPTGAYIHLHNVYLQYAAERGLPALAAFLWWLGKMLTDFMRAARRTARKDGDRRFVLHGAIAVMIAVMAAGWYEHNLGDGEILTLFCAVCGAGYVAVWGMDGRERDGT